MSKVISKRLSMTLVLSILMSILPWGMTSVYAAVSPSVLKVTEEVKPGETISIYGENMTSGSSTHVYLVENSNQDLTIQQYDSEGHVVRVILPSIMLK